MLVRTRLKNPCPTSQQYAETEEETYSAVSKIISDFKVQRVNVTTKFIGFPRIYRRQNGVVNCLERPKWEQPRNLSAEYTATTQDIQIACSTVQGNIVIGHTTIMK
jgi:hypothetical protein